MPVVQVVCLAEVTDLSAEPVSEDLHGDLGFGGSFQRDVGAALGFFQCIDEELHGGLCAEACKSVSFGFDDRDEVLWWSFHGSNPRGVRMTACAMD